MIVKPYNRMKAIIYAKKWALKRNPDYFDYKDIGGDCTNFASQCVYAGSGVMNYTPTFGWYYNDANDKSPSWTGVQFFYDFMTTNKEQGPFAKETMLKDLMLGDIIQFAAEDEYTHTLVLTGIKRVGFRKQYYVSAHSNDADMRPLSTYKYSKIRGIHILGVRE